MRYRRGSLNVSNFRDEAILRSVGDSRYVTHSQLYEFAELEYGEFNRPVFNWRIRRMVEGGLVRKQSIPILGGDALYSITRAGTQALERLGTYYLGANVEGSGNAHEFQVPHALAVNDIRLILERTGTLKRWIPESLIRVLNLSPCHAYAKVYDGIATLEVAGQLLSVAVEFERTLKAAPKYEKIRQAIESEKQITAFLYLVPTNEVLFSLLHTFWRTEQSVLFGIFSDFKKERLGARVYQANYTSIPLLQALTNVAPAKTGT
jgi:hypothetical protein